MSRNTKITVGWLKYMQAVIAKHSTPPRKRGKWKGHGSTNSPAWISEAAYEMHRAIVDDWKRRGHVGDENMALAHLMGTMLLAWYTQVHLAKCLDPSRPLRNRRAALRQRQKNIEASLAALTDPTIMQRVWGHQEFAYPFGKNAKGGTFV